MSSSGQFYQAAARVVERLGLTDSSIIKTHIKQLFDMFAQERHHITFGEAFKIDCRFGDIDTSRTNGYWMEAFGNPTNGYNELNGRKFTAANCGIFTFDLVDLIEDNSDDDNDSQESTDDFDSIVDKFIQDHKNN